jgi:hypothetical protein
MSGLPSDGKEFTYEEVKRFVENPLQETMFPMIASLTPMLFMLDIGNNLYKLFSWFYYVRLPMCMV